MIETSRKNSSAYFENRQERKSIVQDHKEITTKGRKKSTGTNNEMTDKKADSTTWDRLTGTTWDRCQQS